MTDVLERGARGPIFQISVTSFVSCLQDWCFIDQLMQTVTI